MSKKTRISLNVEVSQYNEIKEISGQTKIPMSELIRQGINVVIGKYKGTSWPGL